MIYIKEDYTKSVPGITSLFVFFTYHPEYIEIIKQCDCYSYDKKTKVWEVPITSLSSLLDKLCLFDEIQVDLMEEQKDISKIYELSDYKTKPFYYQEDAIQFGLNHDNFLLLDAPGLGKSLAMIYLAQELKKKDGIQHCLVICGINALKTNWEREIKTHSDLTYKVLGKKISRNGRVSYGGIPDRIKELSEEINEFFVITNIETIRNNDIVKLINKGKNKFDMIVFDEVHKAKGTSSQQAKNLLKIKSEHKIALTGTPLLNSPLDALMPLKWIGVEHSSKSTFEHYYTIRNGFQFLGYRNTDVLKDQLKKYSLRRTKDLLDLPPKTIIHEFVEMEKDQRDFYDEVVHGIKDNVDLVKLSTVNLLALVARLRQATAFPGILSSKNISSAKIERAVDLVSQIVENGDKVIVYSTFKPTLKPLQEKLQQYNPVICTGDIDDATIAKNIDNFQNSPDSKVFLATWQKMGTGFTLTAASYIIFIDCAWTHGENVQAEDRIYRIGSKNPVFIYYLWCKDTIDERVKEIVEKKEIVSNYIVDGKINQDSVDSLRKYIADL